MKREKLQSIQNGFEYDLSEVQISLINERIRLGAGKYYPSIQGKRYGYLAFEMPKSGYCSHLGTAEFKRLQETAQKAHATLYVSNCFPENVTESFNARILFVAQSN
jgi:hypothetical protein